MFPVAHLHVLSHDLEHLVGHRSIAHTEIPYLRRDAADHVLRELALVSLAHPALPGKLLQYAGALAYGIRPRQGEPCPTCRHQNDQNREHQCNTRNMSTEPCGRIVHGHSFVHRGCAGAQYAEPYISPLQTPPPQGLVLLA